MVFEGEPEMSTTGMKLSWIPIDKRFWNGEEISYKVIVSQGNKTVKMIITNKHNVITSGLQPEELYTVIVSGTTVLGTIPPAVVYAKTKPRKEFACGG